MNNLEKFSKKFTNEFIDAVEIKRSFFLESNSLKEVRDSVSLEPLNSGLFLGKDDFVFRPSAAFLELVSKSSSNKVFINEKAEWLFLCGRDVFTENVVKNKSSFDLFLVQNERDENLGLGKFVKKGKQEFIKNVFDRGDFLRREK